MRIQFWGTRGSIPAPLKSAEVEEKIFQAIMGLPKIDTHDPEAVRAYIHHLPLLVRGTVGGNTPCVEIRSGKELLIIDAGSGLRELGQALMREGPYQHGQGTVHLFISHPHWDHIQGFTMFPPAFVPGNRILIYGPPIIKQAFENQQNSINWPVTIYKQSQEAAFMRAEVVFTPIQAGQPFSIGSVRINTIRNPHPGGAYGYRFEEQSSVCVYASDAEYKDLDSASLQPHIDFFRRADVLIFDAQYTWDEVYSKVDWGHSSALIGTDMARAAGVKKLILFHHDPTYSDTNLETIRQQAIQYQADNAALPPCEIIIAHEGLTLDLETPGDISWQTVASGETAVLTPARVFDEGGVNNLAEQLGHLDRQSPNLILDMSQIETLTTPALKSLVHLRRERKETPTILAALSDNARRVIEVLGYLDYFAIYPSVEAALEAVLARENLNLPGQILKGRYQIESKVGAGGLGDVLKASDIHTGRTVAVKLLSPCFSPTTVERFMYQAAQVISLAHPAIAPTYAWEREAEHTFLVEEFINAPTLQHLLENASTPLPIDQAIDIAMAVARALEYAHSRGVVHTALKPHNIFMTGDGIRVNGFGLGRLEEGRNLIKAPMLFMNASYLAPEQVLGQALDARTDLYALGIMFYQLLTGHLPFAGSDREVLLAHLNQTPIPPRDFNPAISMPLEHLVLKLMAKNPNDRYLTAQQALDVSGGLSLHTHEPAIQSTATLVGRDACLQALQTYWQEASAGRGQVVLISGEPGIGKTSLALQAARQINARVRLEGKCREFEGEEAYYLISQVLKAYFSTVPPELLDEQSRQWVSNFVDLVPQVRQMLPDLPQATALDPEYEQLRLVSSLARFLQQATRERPWLIILHDLQWADSSSLDVLRYLQRHLSSMAILYIGTYRDIELKPEHPLMVMLRDVSGNPAYHHIELGRLDQAEVDHLLVNLWRQPVPNELVHQIYRQTGGNPLYVEEVARGLVDSGVVVVENGQLQFSTSEAISLPQNVREAVISRIARLNSGLQHLLRQAAVLGPTFKFEDLCAMSGLPEWQALEYLDIALERQLVQEIPGDNLLRFRHTEIQHVLYTDLGPLRRRMLHRQAGEALERRAPTTPQSMAAELAYHFEQAGEFAKAIPYSLQAAHQAQAAYANDTALVWFQRSLELLSQLGPQKAASLQALHLPAHIGMGQVLNLVGRYDDALTHYTHALTLVKTEPLSNEQTRQLADLHYQIASVCDRRGQYKLGLEWLSKGQSYLSQDEASLELAHNYALSGRLYTRLGEPEQAMAQLEQALKLARQIGSREVETDSLRLLGSVYRSKGDHIAAKQYYERSISICKQLGDRLGEGMSLNNLGVIAQDVGDYATAKDCYTRFLAVAQETGDLYRQTTALNNLGEIATEQGDYANAQAYYQQALHIRQEIGDRRGESWSLAHLGLLARLTGDYEAARGYCQQAFLITTDIEHGEGQALALTGLGHALVELRSLPEAFMVYQQAVELRRKLEQPNMAMDALAGLAHVALIQADIQQALAYVEDILTHLASHTPEETNGLNHPHLRYGLEGAIESLRIYLTCYRVLAAHQDARANEVLDMAYHLLQERAARLSDAQSQRTFLEQVTVHQEIIAAWKKMQTET